MSVARLQEGPLVLRELDLCFTPATHLDNLHSPRCFSPRILQDASLISVANVEKSRAILIMSVLHSKNLKTPGQLGSIRLIISLTPIPSKRSHASFCGLVQSFFLSFFSSFLNQLSTPVKLSSLIRPSTNRQDTSSK